MLHRGIVTYEEHFRGGEHAVRGFVLWISKSLVNSFNVMNFW